MFSDVFLFFLTLSHLSTRHDAEDATLTKNNTAQSLGNDFEDLFAHVLVQLFLCT